MGDEFINDLTYDEKVVFLELFCKLIKSDGKIEANEINFLKVVGARYGLDNQLIVKIIREVESIDYVKEAQKISGRSHALQLIKEMCVLANIDNNLHDKELDIIVEVAEVLNIEEEKVIQINRWVLNNFVLAKVGRVILETDNE